MRGSGMAWGLIVLLVVMGFFDDTRAVATIAVLIIVFTIEGCAEKIIDAIEGKQEWR